MKRKWSKAWIAGLTAVALLSGVFAAPAWAAETDENILTDNFESYKVGEILKGKGEDHGWSNIFDNTAGGRGINIQEDTETPGNKVMNMWATADQSTKPYLQISLSDSKDRFLLRFRFRGNGMGSGELCINGTAFELMQITTQAGVRVRNAEGAYETLQTVDKNSFSDYMVVFDPTDWSVDVYIGGTYVGSGFVKDKSNQSPSKLEYVRFMSGFSKTGTSAEKNSTNWDDVSLTRISGDAAQIVVDHADAASRSQITGKLSVPTESDLSGAQLIAANGASAAIRSVTVQNGVFTIVPEEKLEPRASYTLSFEGAEDLFGRPFVPAQFTVKDLSFQLSEPTLYQGDAELSGLQAGTLQAVVRVSNELETARPVTLILALYDANGTMLETACASQTAQEGDSFALSAELSVANPDGCTLKAFVWDSFASRTSLNSRKTWN